ncbi:hypothetical protein, partial [Nocardiopsis sp. FR4]|uniref:hypothetical protein n=1 Tax=Nocardiopsis sp. FR4 TaxID=2605985 RepID=UPI001F3675FD
GIPVQIRWLKAVRAHFDVTIMIVPHGRSHAQAGMSAIAHHVVICTPSSTTPPNALRNSMVPELSGPPSPTSRND